MDFLPQTPSVCSTPYFSMIDLFTYFLFYFILFYFILFSLFFPQDIEIGFRVGFSNKREEICDYLIQNFQFLLEVGQK